MNSRPPAGEALLSIMLMLLTVFITIAAILNYLLHVFVIKPVRGMAVVANHVSMGRDAPEFTLDGKDEISLLAISFNRMRRSLQNAMKMLNEAQQR